MQQTLSVTRKAMTTASSTSAPLLNYSYTFLHPKRTIRYIRTCDEAIRQAKLSASALQGPFLGFDVEWRPNFVKGAPPSRVALIQLASKHEVLLFQIFRAGKFAISSEVLYYTLSDLTFGHVGQLPLALRELLQDTSIKKVGVGIKGMSSSTYPVHTPLSPPDLEDDVEKLRRDWNVGVREVVDLSDIARELDIARWGATRPSGQAIGLAKLVEQYLGVKYKKPKKVQKSNWEKPLSEKQMDCRFSIAGWSLESRY